MFLNIPLDDYELRNPLTKTHFAGEFKPYWPLPRRVNASDEQVW